MQKRLICLVEDDRDIRDAVTDFLEFEGYEVVTCKNGQDALDRISGGLRPDLILLDLMMPILNGWQFLEIFSRDYPDLFAQIPVVIISAARETGTGPSEKAKAYLKKPLEMDDLMRTLEQFCPAPTN
jgi:two-component system response regulator MprA